MAKKLDNDRLISNDLLKPLVEVLDEVLKRLGLMDDELKKVIKTSQELAKTTPLDSYENTKKVEKSLNDVEKAVDGLTENEKKRADVLKKLVEVESEEFKTNALLAEQLKRRQREVKELAQIELDREKGIKTLSTAEKKAAKEAEQANKRRLAQQKAQQKAENERAKERTRNQKELKRQIKAIEKAEQDVVKQEKESEKQIKKLEAESKRLEQQRIREEKVADKLAKTEAFLNREYVKKRKNLEEARDTFNDFFVQTENNRKGLKGLVFRFTSAGKALSRMRKQVKSTDKELSDLDKSTRNAESSIDKLKSTLKKVGAVALGLKLLEGLKESFQANSTSAAVFDKVLGAIAATASVTLNTFVSAIPAFIGLLSSLFAQFQKGALEVKLFAEELKNTFGTGDKKRIKELEDSIASLNKEIENNKGYDDLKKAFKGYFDDVEKAIKASNALVDATQKSRLAVIALNNTLSQEADSIASLSDDVKAITKDSESLLEAEARLEEQSESNVVALQDRAKATKELAIIRAAISDQNVQIAKEERDLALQRVRLTEIGSKDGAKNLEAREQLAQAERALTDAQVQATKDRVMSEREARDIETDLIERNLDFIIDDAEARINANKRIADDETQTFAKRRALTAENRRLGEKSFRDSIDEINKGIKAGKEKLDFDKLAALEDSRLVAQAIENSGLNDKLSARALEIIKTRIAFNQDLSESERDLNKARQEGREVEEEILFLAERLEIIRKNRGETAKELERLESRILQSSLMRINKELDAIKKRREAEAEALRPKIDALEGSTKEEDKIIQESLTRRLQALTGLSKEELDLLKEKAETEIEIETKKNEKIIAQRVKLQETLSTLTDAFFDARFERQNEQLDRQLEAEKTRTQELRDLAKNNVDGATEALATQQKREAEIERRARARKEVTSQAKSILYPVRYCKRKGGSRWTKMR